MQFKNEINKLADIVVWADNGIEEMRMELADIVVWADNGIEEMRMDLSSLTEEKFKNLDAVKDLEAVKKVVLESMERHSVYTSALNKDIADKAAKIELLEKEIEGRKEGYYALKDKMTDLEETLEIRTKENRSLIKANEKLEKESEKWQDLANMNRDTICDQYGVCEDFKKRIVKLEEENEKLKVDLIHEREKNEKLARGNAELENDMRKSYTDIISQSKTICNLKKELEETYRAKEADLNNHSKRDMTLVDELAKKNDEIKKLEESIDYYKNQERIRTDQLRATESKVDELWGLVNELNKEKKEVNGYVESGFKLYVKSALIEAKGDKNEANEIITDAVKFCFNELDKWDKTQKENEKTIKKTIKEVMNKKFGCAWETAVRLRSEVDKKRIVDISEGAEKILGVSRELFDAAVKALVDDGYQEIIGRIPQASNSYVYIDIHVLATPDVETKETANAENIKSLDFDIPCGEDSIE